MILSYGKLFRLKGILLKSLSKKLAVIKFRDRILTDMNRTALVVCKKVVCIPKQERHGHPVREILIAKLG